MTIKKPSETRFSQKSHMTNPGRPDDSDASRKECLQLKQERDEMRETIRKLTERVNELEREREEKHSRLMLGQAAYAVEQYILFDILKERPTYEIMKYTMASIANKYVVLSQEELKRYIEILRSIGVQPHQLVKILNDMKGRRVQDCHPTTLSDGSTPAQYVHLEAIVREAYSNSKATDRKAASGLIQLLNKYKTIEAGCGHDTEINNSSLHNANTRFLCMKLE